MKKFVLLLGTMSYFFSGLLAEAEEVPYTLTQTLQISGSSGLNTSKIFVNEITFKNWQKKISAHLDSTTASSQLLAQFAFVNHPWRQNDSRYLQKNVITKNGRLIQFTMTNKFDLIERPLEILPFYFIDPMTYSLVSTRQSLPAMRLKFVVSATQNQLFCEHFKQKSGYKSKANISDQEIESNIEVQFTEYQTAGDACRFRFHYDMRPQKPQELNWSAQLRSSNIKLPAPDRIEAIKTVLPTHHSTSSSLFSLPISLGFTMILNDDAKALKASPVRIQGNTQLRMNIVAQWYWDLVDLQIQYQNNTTLQIQSQMGWKSAPQFYEFASSWHHFEFGAGLSWQSDLSRLAPTAKMAVVTPHYQSEVRFQTQCWLPHKLLCGVGLSYVF